MLGIYGLVAASAISLAQTTRKADFLFPHGLSGVEHDQLKALKKTGEWTEPYTHKCD